MIALDDRAGSLELIRYLPQEKVKLTRLSFGDAAFVGNGPNGDLVPVGVEVKTVSDCLNCIQDGRFAGHQLPGLQKEYAVAYLVVEGPYRGDPVHHGMQIMKRGKWVSACHGNRIITDEAFNRWLLSMELLGGIRIRTTFNRRETAQFIITLYHWWVDKQWDQHDSIHVYDHSGFAPSPSLMRRIVKELPGIGWKRSRAVERHFKDLTTMWNATPEDWQKVPGIGKKIAYEVWYAIHI